MAARDLPASIRGRFPIFKRKVYVNSCSQGALSDSVRAAYQRYLDDWDERGAPWEYWVELMEAAREEFAGLIGADGDEVAVTTSVSAGVSALASAFRFDQGRDTIVVSDFEFPTIGQIWHAQELRGARVVHVPAERDGTIPLERFEAAVDERTALVAVTAVCFRNGSRIDVEGVTRLAHQRDASVLLDAYQAVGALPIDVRAMEVDFLAAGVLKYLLGSAGLAFLYCRAEHVKELVPTATGWFADADIFQMDVHDYSPSPTARRFEAGTPPVPNIYAGIAGIRLLREIGVAATAEHVRGLNDLLLEGLDELGARVVTPRDPARRGPLIAVESSDVHALVEALAADEIVTSSRDANLRISPHCYNSTEDIRALLDSLARHRDLLVTAG
ncbi:MAG TPA: aminotransferase class V-fold PLP-dependent enzyme [Actinomycetes bacterium]